MIEQDEWGRRYKQVTTLAECPDGHEWTVHGKGYESGWFDPNKQKDLICPECGKWGKINPDNQTEEE